MSTTELTKEEFELFTMYSKGKKIYEIAQEVESSRAIVSKKMDNVVKRMKAINKLDAMCRLLREKIL